MMRYAHLAPEARESALQQLDRPVPLQLHAAPATDAGAAQLRAQEGMREKKKPSNPLKLLGFL